MLRVRKRPHLCIMQSGLQCPGLKGNTPFLVPELMGAQLESCAPGFPQEAKDSLPFQGRD